MISSSFVSIQFEKETQSSTISLLTLKILSPDFNPDFRAGESGITLSISAAKIGLKLFI